MAVSTEIIDKDMGFDDVIAGIKMSRELILKSGIFEDAPPYPEDNGITSVAEVAAMQEYGFPGSRIGRPVPPRPFMATSFDKNEEKWYLEFGNVLGPIPEPTGIKSSLEKTGVVIAKDIQQTIEDFTDPPNNPDYVKNQKPDIGNNPLIRTRHMKNSVESKVLTRWDS